VKENHYAMDKPLCDDDDDDDEYYSVHVPQKQFIVSGR
jgi:hypothetical protein